MTQQCDALDPREERAWKAFRDARHRLAVELNRHLLVDSDMTDADYAVLAVLSEQESGRASAQELGGLLEWEKSRLSHQVRRMEEAGLVERRPNPADGRSCMIHLLPAGASAIADATPRHLDNIRRHFVDLFTPEELDTFATLNERVLGYLAEGATHDCPITRPLRASTSAGRAPAE